MSVAATDLRRAEALLEVNRLDDAARTLGVFIATNPDSFLAWALLARCHGMQGLHHEMLGAAQRAVRLEPGNEVGHRLLTRALLNLDRPHEARAAGTEAVRLAPHSWLTHLTLGGAVLAAKDLRLAWRSGVRARELAPDEAGTHAFCADVLQAMADAGAARANYREALRLDPAHLGARHNLAVLDYYGGRLVMAAAGFGAAVAGAPMVDEYARNAQLAARAVLWRLADWAAPVFLICWLTTILVDRRLAVAELPLLITGYVALAIKIFNATPRGIRAEIRRRLTKPLFGLAVVVIVVLLATAIATTFGPWIDSAGIVASVVIIFRVRNRVSRRVWFLVRRTYYRAGRRPRS